MMPHFKESEAGHIEADVLLQDMTCVPANSFYRWREALRRSPSESDLCFDACVKTNKELLLERVTEPRRYAPGTRLGGHSEKEWF